MSKEMPPFPKLLYKSFTQLEHAENFLAGNVRFSTLKHFREIEDAHRRDRTEGIGQARVNGEELVVELSARTISTRPGVEDLEVVANQSEHFICCFSTCESGCLEDIPLKFGRYCVRVDDPAAFFHDVAGVIAADDKLSQNPPTLEGDQVRYDKGVYISARPDRDEVLRLAWTQKPEYFSDEREFRYHFQFSFASLIGYPSIYELPIGRQLEYCEIFELSS